LVILQQLLKNIELDLKALMSSCPTSQLLIHDVLTICSFLHRPLQLLSPNLNLPKRHLQVSNLLLGVLQGGVKLLFTVAEAYEMS
jgi:hypothetical protein